MTNLEMVKQEAQIVKKQIEIVKSDFTKLEKISKIINEQLKSKFRNRIEYFSEWVTGQINENDLPEMSSGSFITALKDTDGLFYELNVSNEEYDNLAKVFNNITR